MYSLTNKRGSIRRTGCAALAKACLWGLLVLSACAPRNPTGKGAGLFAMDSLLHAQAINLSLRQASLTKDVLLQGKQETVNLTPKDSTAWLKELEAFGVMASINKPINRDHYDIAESADSRSNLRVRSFSTHDELPVPFVRLYYYRSPANIRRIESAYVTHNELYKTYRKLTLEFEDVRGTPIITSYSITGDQKMILDDTVRYDIKGRVNLATK